MSLDELRRALNEVHKVEVGDHLATATTKWLKFLARPIALDWRDDGHELHASHEESEFVIRHSEETYALRAHFRVGWRVLARGDVENLKVRAESTLRIGGPFGGPCWELDDQDPAAREMDPGARGRPRTRTARAPQPAPPGRTKSAAMMSWSLSLREQHAWIHPVGAGYEARLRLIRDRHAVFVIGPHGTFCFDRFELLPNAVEYAAWFCRVFDDLVDDFSPDVQPFHVRVRGVPHRLIYTPIPGLAGHVRTDVGDVFLCIPGDDLVALVMFHADGEPVCVASGRPHELNGRELRPEELPQDVPELTSTEPDALARTIDKFPRISAPVRAHFVSLAHRARKAAGTETAREILWGVCVAHANGRRDNLCLPNGEFFGWLHAHRVIAALPDERTQRAAANWLAENSPLFARIQQGRTCLRRIQFEWFSTPSEECLRELARRTNHPEG